MPVQRKILVPLLCAMSLNICAANVQQKKQKRGNPFAHMQGIMEKLDAMRESMWQEVDALIDQESAIEEQAIQPTISCEDEKDAVVITINGIATESVNAFHQDENVIEMDADAHKMYLVCSKARRDFQQLTIVLEQELCKKSEGENACEQRSFSRSEYSQVIDGVVIPNEIEVKYIKEAQKLVIRLPKMEKRIKTIAVTVE